MGSSYPLPIAYQKLVHLWCLAIVYVSYSAMCVGW